MNEEFKIEGLKELFETLQDLPVRLEKNILRGAFRAGAKPVHDEARRRAPVLSEPDPRRVFGALSKSIHVLNPQLKGGVMKGGVIAGGRATVGRGKQKTTADAYYAHWVEFGHLVRHAGNALKGGDRSKKGQREALMASGAAFVPARPFLRPAIDSKTQASIAATADYIRARVEAGGLKK